MYFDSCQTAKSDDKTDKSLNFADIKNNILVLKDENQFVKNKGLSPSKTPSKEQLWTRCIGRRCEEEPMICFSPQQTSSNQPQALLEILCSILVRSLSSLVSTPFGHLLIRSGS
jgi:hypothetical protein